MFVYIFKYTEIKKFNNMERNIFNPRLFIDTLQLDIDIS